MARPIDRVPIPVKAMKAKIWKAYKEGAFDWRNRVGKLSRPTKGEESRNERFCDLCRIYYCGRERDKRFAQALRELRPAMEALQKARIRKRVRQATPEWADKVQIAAVYLEARKRTEETGIAHDVDHIVPLKGVSVCGLHVETNLQILTADENRRKRNKWDVDDFTSFEVG